MNIALSLNSLTPAGRMLTGSRALARLLKRLSAVADLAARLWVANVFFKSGLVKLQSWDSTVSLFTYEYQVPLLSPETAAYLGTVTELCFPVLLTLGLLGRFPAAVLFLFNIVAVISYPDLNAVGLEQHQVWGLLLFYISTHGVGKLSLDNLWHLWARKRVKQS